MPREQLPLKPPENNRPVVRRITREQMAQRINENDIRFRGRIPRFSFSAKDNSKEASIKERLNMYIEGLGDSFEQFQLDRSYEGGGMNRDFANNFNTTDNVAYLDEVDNYLNTVLYGITEGTLIIDRQGFEVIADIMKNRIAYYHQRLV